MTTGSGTIPSQTAIATSPISGTPIATTIPTGGSYGQSQTQTTGQTVSTSGPVQTLQSLLSAAISDNAQQLGNAVYNWAQTTLGPNGQLTDQVVNNLLGTAGSQSGLSNTLNQQYNTTGVPALNAYSEAAGSYGSPARQQFNAGQAEAGSVQGSQAGISAAQQQLQGFGINPTSGMYAELTQSNQAAAGAAAAAAGTTAAQQTRNEGLTLQQGLVSATQQLPGASTNAANTATSASGAAQNANLANTATSASALGAGDPYLNTAQNLTAPSTASNSESTNQSTSESTNKADTSQALPVGGLNPGSSGLPTIAHGGAIPTGGATTGGFVSKHLSPSHGQVTDDIPARLNADEFVMPRDVSKYYGQKTFQDMILKARKAMTSNQQSPAKPQMQTEPGFAMGGTPMGIPMGVS